MKRRISIPSLVIVFLALSVIAILGFVFVMQAEDSLAAPAPGENAPGAGGGPVIISRTYTSDADFNEGTLINVNLGSGDQIKLNQNLTTFPFIWIALSSRGTIVKIDTSTGAVLGEYLSAPDNRYRNPSRTTVDMNGNVWVGNRDEGEGGLGSATHVALNENSQCVDRNNNGQIDTSTALGDVRPWPNPNGEDNAGGVTTAQDECIIHYVRVGSQGTRHLSVDANNNAWIGGNNQFGWDDRRFSLVDGFTGAVLESVGPFQCGGYGGLVDGNGVLWSAGEWSGLLRYDPLTDNATCISSPMSYGLGLDLNGNIWNANWTNNTVSKYAPDGALIGTYSSGGSCARGVAVTADNNIWIANSCSDLVARLLSNGALVTTISVGSHPTGVAVDAAGKVWVTNYNSWNAMRIDPATNQVDMQVSLGDNAYPYNYSDMTGIVALRSTAPQGTWTVIFDSGKASTPWGTISWNSDEPNGSRVSVRARGADSEADLGGSTYVPVTSTVTTDQISNGRYLQVEVKLEPGDANDSPTLFDLTVQSRPANDCRLAYDKTVSPDWVTAGGTVTVNFSLEAVGTCDATNSPVDVVLILDRSGSMAGQKLADAKAAAIAFVNQMNLSLDQAGVVSFASTGAGSLDSPLTHTAANVTAAINGLSASGTTDIIEGLTLAENELLNSGRHVANHVPLIILLSDGQHNESPVGDLATAANRIKGEGIRIISIGLGNADETQLRAIASSADDYYYTPTSDQLQAIYQQIAPTVRVAARNVVITDNLSSFVTLVPNTFYGPVDPEVNGNQIIWRIAAVPTGVINLGYQVVVSRATGNWSTNDGADLSYTDSVGNQVDLTFPNPQVTVPMICTQPDLTDVAPVWGCVNRAEQIQLNGGGFFTMTEAVADSLGITGTFSMQAGIGPQPLTVGHYNSNLIEAVLPSVNVLGPGSYDVTIVSTCALTNVVPGSPYTTETPPAPVVLPPPTIFTDVLPDGFRLYPVPNVLNVRPPEGYGDLASDISICGNGFDPNTQVFIRVNTVDVPLENQATFGDTCMVGTVPVGLAPGDYEIVVKGMCGEAFGAYRVLNPALNDDLWSQNNELWVSPSICSYVTDDIDLGLVVNRRGGKAPLNLVTVRFYEDSVDEANKIGDGTIAFLSPRVGPGEKVPGSSTSAVRWTPSRGVGQYTIYAVIDPLFAVNEDVEENNVYSHTVQILPATSTSDQVAPHVDDLQVNAGVDTVYSRDIKLQASVTDLAQEGVAPSGVTGLNFVEFLFNKAAGAWVPVSSSGWFTFTAATPISKTIDWTLSAPGGLRFLQAWATDARGNISRYPFQTMINYAPPCDRVSRDGTHTYRQSLKAGDKLHVKVAPCQGDPDLYIWSPDWANVPGRPAWVSNLANNNKEFLEFVAPVNGEYQIEIYGYTAAQYNIQIEVTPGATELFIRNVFLTPQLYAQTISAGVDPLKDQPSAPALPPASRPSTDAGFVPVVPPPVELPIIRIIFLPAIRR